MLKMDAPPIIAVLSEPLGVAVTAVRRAAPKLGETIVVQGCGAIGLLTLGVARQGMEWGKRVHVVIQPRDCATLSEKALVGFCRSKIASYQIPRYLKLIDGFPTTVDRRRSKVQGCASWRSTSSR